jgi:hypothetical protein
VLKQPSNERLVRWAIYKRTQANADTRRFARSRFAFSRGDNHNGCFWTALIARHGVFPLSRTSPRAQLRVRKRLPRHRERRRDRHLHPHPVASPRRHLFGLLELDRRADVRRWRRVQHRRAAAGRACAERRLWSWVRDGVLAPDFRDHLERRHLVPRPARVQLAYSHRFDHGRRAGQLPHVARPFAQRGGQLAAGGGRVSHFAGLAYRRLFWFRRIAAARESVGETPRAVRSACARRQAAAMDPGPVAADLHRCQLGTATTTAKRAWDSSC